MTDMPESPECKKMLAVKDQSQAIGEFLDWLRHDQDVHLMRWLSVEHKRPCKRQMPSLRHQTLTGMAKLEAEFAGRDPETVVVPTEWHAEDCVCKGTNFETFTEEGWMPLGLGIEKLLALYFGIDLNKADEEKRAILKALADAQQ